MKVVILGAPGSGKGTQATKISEKYNLPHISTGDMFRENIRDMTPLGILAKGYIDKGQLCPDDVTVRMVEDRINRSDCANGFILDGFPRTLAQAHELDKVVKIDLALDIDVPLDRLLKRLTGRRCCKDCGETFHVDYIGEVSECPRCGGALYVRDDDNEQTVSKRIDVYVAQTVPLVNFYKSEGCLRRVDGDTDIEEVFAQIVKVMDVL